MINGSLPAVMVFAALALMLGLGSPRVALIGTSVACVADLGVTFIRLPAEFADAALMACWTMIGVIGVFVHVPYRPSLPVVAALSIAAGLVAGATLGAPAHATSPYHVLPVLLASIPALIVAARGYRIALRVVMSWLLAVTLLAAVMPFAVSHPGYIPDHRE